MPGIPILPNPQAQLKHLPPWAASVPLDSADAMGLAFLS